MCIRLNLYPERHTLLTAMLLRREFSANAVNFDGNFCLHLWPRIPDKLDAVQLMWVNLHVQQAAAQWDIYTSLQHTPSLQQYRDDSRFLIHDRFQSIFHRQ